LTATGDRQDCDTVIELVATCCAVLCRCM